MSQVTDHFPHQCPEPVQQESWPGEVTCQDLTFDSHTMSNMISSTKRRIWKSFLLMSRFIQDNIVLFLVLFFFFCPARIIIC